MLNFVIDLRTTDITLAPQLVTININYIQAGIYQKVQTGKGTDWEVYNLSETQTAFAYKGSQPVTAIMHILPLV